jgi:hypothetical protein
MNQGANIPQPSNEADLICEALVNEINRAGRWKAIVDAWQALLTVRRMQSSMEAERSYLSGAGAAGAGPAGSPLRA